MEHLIFRLYAPLASFGEVAVGEYRGSHLYPARSALLGLLAAALGIEREDETAHQILSYQCLVAVALLEPGLLLRDYHTAQVPSASTLKKHPHRTRADELAFAKDDLNTILSSRDYRQDAASLVAVTLRQEVTPRWSLETLRTHLRSPRFTLYLGRKCCPPALPLQPRVVQAETLSAAFADYQRRDREAAESAAAMLEKGRDHRAQRQVEAQHDVWAQERIVRVAWEDGMESGVADSLRIDVLRKDQPLSRRRWQFADRTEHVAVLAPETTTENAA